MQLPYTFPFGEPVWSVEQQDRTPKRVFVLGVYASAVHARWIDSNGKTRVNALAVASEPYIFWRGDGAGTIIEAIDVPSTLGHLKPASPTCNGPSGIALDELFLDPLQIGRHEAWLCDLLPHSCMNPKQQAAIKREYLPLVEPYGLPPATVPPVPHELADSIRRQAILDEFNSSHAEILILLGDKPIHWFLKAYEPRWRTLSAFGTTEAAYGRFHEVKLADRWCCILPLAHPRQAAKLGAHSERWFGLHRYWVQHTAQQLKL
jgi:hypothetical protein